jgi:hypothetical protein
MFLKLLASIFGTAGVYVLYGVVKIVYREFTSPFRHLPGPKSVHWFFGNLKEFMEDVRDFLWMHCVLITNIFFWYRKTLGCRSAVCRNTDGRGSFTGSS